MIELYRFTDGATVYRYTSADRDITYDSATWTAIPIGRGPVSRDREDAKNSLSIEMPSDNAIVLMHVTSPPDVPVAVEVLSGETVETIAVIARAVVSGVSISGNDASLDCQDAASDFDRPAPRLRYQRLCRWALYSRGCSLSADANSVTALITEVDATNQLRFRVADLTAFGADWARGGHIVVRGQARLVLSQDSSGWVEISRPITGLIATDSAKTFAGCDRTRATCNSKFSNLANFGGIPALPKRNPHERNINWKS